jgi:ribonucleoside-triphosphate reductase (thioredoxin)
MDKSVQILSDITAYMKYARYIPDKKRRELWDETVKRTMDMHIKKFPELKEEIEYAFSFVQEKKVLASMRSHQFAGKPIEVNPVRLYNCSYENLDHLDAFAEAMFLMLSGTGVGYSVQKHHVRKLPPILGVQRPEGRQRKKRYLVADNIEG